MYPRATNAFSCYGCSELVPWYAARGGSSLVAVARATAVALAGAV